MNDFTRITSAQARLFVIQDMTDEENIILMQIIEDFRAWVNMYLNNHPEVSKKIWSEFVVRSTFIYFQGSRENNENIEFIKKSITDILNHYGQFPTFGIIELTSNTEKNCKYVTRNL